MSQTTLPDLEARLCDGAELRAVEKGKTRRFEGRAVPYGSWALVAGRFEEQIRAGAFAKSLNESAAKLPLMLAHKLDELPLGHLEEWRDADDGLYGTWRVSDGSHADDAWTAVREGNLSGLSIHFRPLQDEWEERQPPQFHRVTRLQARLMEVSLCAIPTWGEARVTQTRTAKGGPVKYPHLHQWSKYFDDIKISG